MELIIGWMPYLVNFNETPDHMDDEEYVKGGLILGPGYSIDNNRLFNLNLPNKHNRNQIELTCQINKTSHEKQTKAELEEKRKQLESEEEEVITK